MFVMKQYFISIIYFWVYFCAFES